MALVDEPPGFPGGPGLRSNSSLYPTSGPPRNLGGSFSSTCSACYLVGTMIRLCSLLAVGLLLVGGIGGMDVVELIYHPCGDTPVFCFGEPRKCHGLINDRGELLHRFAASHSINGPFNEGLIAAESPASGRWGYLDTRGQSAIQPTFRGAHPFRDGLARVQDVETGLWGFINHAGDSMITPRFEEVADFDQEGFAAFYVGSRYSGDGRAGVINRSGDVVINPQFLILGAFSNGFAQAVLDEEACILVHRNGDFIVLGDPDDATSNPRDCRRIAIDTEGEPRADVDPATLISFRSTWDAFPNLALPARYRLDPTYDAAGRSCHGLDQIHRYEPDGTHDAAFVDQAGKTVFAWKWRW